MAEAVRKVLSMWAEVRESWERIIEGLWTVAARREAPKRFPVMKGAMNFAILSVEIGDIS